MIGKTISHYKILEKLGEGGMGVVYKAEDTKLKRFVALKFLPSNLTQDSEAKQRFVKEAQAASALQHANICTIHEINETDDGQLYISMEYLDGKTLKERIKEAKLTVEETIDIINQIAQGLEKAHKKGIVHRDIKPANIIVTDDGVVKIVDFGLAKLTGQTKLTKTGSTLGTVAYMSPEQAQGKDIDYRTDIWSLGVIFFELLTGDNPFKGEYEQAVIYSILNEEPVPLSKVNPAVTLPLEGIVLHSLAKRLPDRYQSLEDLRVDLKAFMEGQKPIRTRVVRHQLFRLRMVFVYIGLGLLLLMIGSNIGGIRDRIFSVSGYSGRIVRLAVLPFVNLSNNTEEEYFSDGITQEMINELGRLHPEGLSVIGRTSVMRYKNTNTPVDQIGQELGVDYILEGSIQREAERVRIMAELVNVKDETTLWGESFDREISGILTLQSEVARKLANALTLKLLPDEERRLTSARTVNPEAHDLYLKGTMHWNRLTEKDLDIAEYYFEQALNLDSTYAPIYEGLAAVWSAQQQMGFMTMKEAGPRATEFALRAIAIDPNSAHGHFAIALNKAWIQWDWEVAKPSWERTLELIPNNATVQVYYANYLALTGKLNQVFPHSELAVKLDPFNAMIHGMHAANLNCIPRYEDAEEAARTALRLQPDLSIAKSNLIRALLGQKKFDEVIALRKQGFADDPELLSAYERGLSEGGYRSAERRIAEIYEAWYKKGGKILRAQTVGGEYFEAGDYERAISWFEKALENHEGNLPYITRPHYYNILKSYPAYLDILRGMGVPVEW